MLINLLREQSGGKETENKHKKQFKLSTLVSRTDMPLTNPSASSADKCKTFCHVIHRVYKWSDIFLYVGPIEKINSIPSKC